MWGVTMQSDKRKYVVFAILLGVVIPVNYFLFNGIPNEEIEEVEEKIIEDTTGITVDLTK
jgi:hypothetical protein